MLELVSALGQKVPREHRLDGVRVRHRFRISAKAQNPRVIVAVYTTCTAMGHDATDNPT